MTTPTNEARVQEVLELASRLIQECRTGDLTTIGMVWDFLESALRSLAASATQVPQGWKLVPVEPTEEMLNAGISARRDMGATEDVFAAMVAASPPTPQAATQGEAVATRDELLDIARAVEGLKQECGMDPESPRAIQNGRYMSIAYRLRSLAAINEPASAPSKEQTNG